MKLTLVEIVFLPHSGQKSLNAALSDRVLSDFCSLLFQMTASDLKDNLKKLNNSMAFLIKHSQKLFRVITVAVIIKYSENDAQ